MNNLTDFLMKHFFAERSFSPLVKISVFLATLIFSFIFIYLIFLNHFSTAEARLILYIFYLIIFYGTFFCGFWPGFLLATICSIPAIKVIGANFLQHGFITVSDMEILPFVAFYYLVAIAVDWFRVIIERLKSQLEENKRLNEQTRQMEKLVLAGEIAAGIAHEIRNPLTVVQGYIQLQAAKHKHEQNESATYALILSELKRANQIISEFLNFSRPHQPSKKPIQLTEIIKTTISLMSAESQVRNIEILLQSKELPFINADPGQMIQVFMNLFTNAMQAMPDGGKITVETGYSKEEDQIIIHIHDTGHGIPQESLERIFTPFFTTKDHGTGLGLWMTQAIILAHGGLIDVTSSQQGTTFTVVLPVEQQDILPIFPPN